MAGHIVLAGGAEFGGHMADVDRAAMQLAGGANAPIRVVPTAAAPDNNHQRAGQNAVRWFQSLGARDVVSLPLVDAASANDAQIADELRAARLIYMLGGFTHYLGQTLKNSASWAATLEAYAAGAVVAGSSAGAMVLCEWYYNPERAEPVAGLGMVANACVLPHHNSFGQRWAPALAKRLPQVTLVGIDERTGVILAQTGAGWAGRCYGQGAITIYRGGAVTASMAGAEVAL